MAGRGRRDEVVDVKVPVVTGAGRRLELDTEGMDRLVLAEACDDMDPRLWGLFPELGSVLADVSDHRKAQAAANR
jgi:hypothetical protein